MALKSEQARVLRRRVLGRVIRNLVIFTALFALGCFVAEKAIVPTVANYVADSTSVWRTLDSSDDYRQLLTEQGMFDSPDFSDQVDALIADGFSNEEGSIADVQEELSEGSELIQKYAISPEAAKKMQDVPQQENASDIDAAASSAGTSSLDIAEQDADVTEEEAKKMAADKGAAAGARDEDEFISQADKPTDSVPYISYEDILAAFGISLENASAAQAMAALHASAMIQELHLSLTREPPFMPAQFPEEQANQVLAIAALYGYPEQEFITLLADTYTASQQRAYETWQTLNAADQARELGISDDQPVWQIEYDAQGSYVIRDVATYTFIKSFKLPLVLLVFTAGLLVIVFRSLNRSLRYFDDLSGAVASLLADKDAPINLPSDLSIARNELTVIRQQSLADERAAHAAEQRKNELVAYLAHDIRTPLTSVLGYLDLLRETTDLPRDTLRHYADIAYTKAERLESLINEFFEITRYNLSAIPIERETVGVRLFCQQVAESFFPEASARNIRISVDVGPAEQFFVDPDKLARALGNVLRNAVAYADPNSVIALAARQDARFTTITVSNRGREISEAHLESIFEKFYREDGARTTRSGGAGLGLAIAKEIVVAHHGDIEAASRRGVTVFTLCIPTHGEDETAQSQPLPTGRPAIVPPAREGRPEGVGTAAGRRGARASEASGSFAIPKAEAPTGSRVRPNVSGVAPAAPRLNPRYARHGRRPAAPSVRDNGATKRTQPSRRHR